MLFTIEKEKVRFDEDAVDVVDTHRVIQQVGQSD